MEYQEVKNKFAADLKRSRKEIKKSQRKVASELGISLTAYQNWEGALSLPKYERLTAVCEYFGLDENQYNEFQALQKCDFIRA